MTDKLDIALVLNDQEKYDIDLDSNGDLLSTDGFDSSILLSLGIDARASQAEVSDPIKRRGFIGDEFYQNENFQHGSKLWLLDQSRVRNNTRNLAVNYSELALQWMINDEYLTTLNAIGVISPTEGISVQINGVTLSGETISFAYNVWQNTLRKL